MPFGEFILMKRITCGVIGDRSVGKSSMLISYTTNALSSVSELPRFDTYWTNILFEGQQIDLQLWNTIGQQYPRGFRSPSSPHFDLFIICFSLVEPLTLRNVQTIWVPELRQHYPATPFILVGLKSDLRDSSQQCADEWRSKGMEPIPSTQGETMAHDIGAGAYIECSTRRQRNLNDVFETAIKLALHPSPPVRRPAYVNHDVSCCAII
jgi:Ras-related C3 botulinum toxin substrate 1